MYLCQGAEKHEEVQQFEKGSTVNDKFPIIRQYSIGLEDARGNYWFAILD